jgi:hypothetical protein
MYESGFATSNDEAVNRERHPDYHTAWDYIVEDVYDDANKVENGKPYFDMMGLVDGGEE